MSKRYSGKSFKDSSIMKKSKLSFKEKRKLKKEKRSKSSDLGGTMRLGGQVCKLVKSSNAHKMYKQDEITERHRHRYEVNPLYKQSMIEAGLKVVGTSVDGKLVEMIEMPDHGEANTDHLGHFDKVFTGHFHKRQARKNVWYMGNAFPHNYADAGDDARGMMVLEWDEEPVFHSWPDQPVYRVYKLSEVLENPKGLLIKKPAL